VKPSGVCGFHSAPGSIWVSVATGTSSDGLWERSLPRSGGYRAIQGERRKQSHGTRGSARCGWWPPRTAAQSTPTPTPRARSGSSPLGRVDEVADRELVARELAVRHLDVVGEDLVADLLETRRARGCAGRRPAGCAAAAGSAPVRRAASPRTRAHRPSHR
jgi:hypothetical protein